MAFNFRRGNFVWEEDKKEQVGEETIGRFGRQTKAARGALQPVPGLCHFIISYCSGNANGYITNHNMEARE
jgi:hypothetical protein